MVFLTAAAFTQNHSELSQDSIFIPWTFEMYAEADFNSPVTARLSSQHVLIVEQAADGWAMIKAGEDSGWINLEFSPAICTLDDFFAPLGNNIAIYFKNLDTGFTYVHNPDRVFFGASLSKSNHALYTYTLMERGLADIYQRHIFTYRDLWGGTGVMRFMNFGTEFTTRELLGLSIRESDNTAYRMLVRMFENAEFSYHDFVREIGADSQMIRNVISQNTHALDAGLFMYNIFNYIESESQFGHYLKYDMLNTAQTSHPYFTRWEGSHGVGGVIDIQMIRSDYPLARKYGWAGNSFHDAGIIYAPSPYILVILSNMERGAHDLFEEISWFVQDFNNRHFVSPTPLNAPTKGPEIYDGLALELALRSGLRVIIMPDSLVQPVFLPIATEPPVPGTKAYYFYGIPHKVFTNFK